MAEQGPKAELSQSLLQWYDAHARTLPWRLKVSDPYKTWLSEIMLQQTQVVTVKDYFLKFLSLWPRVEDLAAAPLDDVLKAWAGLGYYARARNLHACAKVVASQYGGVFPKTVEGLAELPGVGPYTSAAIAAIAFDVPAAAVDGNVERVISRHFGLEQPLPQSKPEIKDLTQQLVPEKRAGDFAQALMDLGATICTPRSPDCGRCPWEAGCVARLMSLQNVLPRKAVRRKVPTRYGHVYWMTNSVGQVLVRARPMRGLLAGMTEIPSCEWAEGEVEFTPPFKADWKKISGIVKHTFTHFHLELVVWKVKVRAAKMDARFVMLEELNSLALPTVMRKVVAHALEN
jgi:A/G-specific adenine glycosylase